MPTLSGYDQFIGRHWETGSVCNYYAYRGVEAPHTGEPYTEALLMGISGGAVMGYFSFAYEGYDPMARILTRNTFAPLDTLLERLGVAQDLRHTAKPEKAVANLVETLESGVPAILWADMFSLPYNAAPDDAGMWAMFPILVYGYEGNDDLVWIADRARAPLSISTADLAAARGRVKKDKNRLMTLAPPDAGKLLAAVQKGIWDCIKLFTEAPPKGSRNNFGFAAYQWWASLLTKPKQRMSWAREFPSGGKMYAGLLSAFEDINVFGKVGCAERDVYADFLDEAALILGKPGLSEAAEGFRQSALAWDALGVALLPDDIVPFGQACRLVLERRDLFLDQGGEALERIRAIDVRLREIRGSMEGDFPLDEGGVTRLRESIAGHVLRVHDVEKTAVAAMQAAMA